MNTRERLNLVAQNLMRGGWTAAGRELRRLANLGHEPPFTMQPQLRYTFDVHADGAVTFDGRIIASVDVVTRKTVRLSGGTKKPDALRRRSMVNLSAEDHALVLKAARSVGSPVSEFLRESALLRAQALVSL